MNLFCTNLEKITSFKYGKMPPKEIINDHGFPIFSGYGITGYATEFLFEESQLTLIARGVGGTGRVVLSPANSWITNLCIVLDLHPSVDKKFMYYKLSKEPLREQLNTGAAQAQITIESLSKYQITIPEYRAQLKIASILSAYDDLIETNLRRIALLEEAARLLYQEWFVRLRFPGYEHTRIVDGVPEGWEATYAPEVISFNPKTIVPKNKENWFVEMSCLSNNTMIISNPVKRFGNSGSKFTNGDTLFARITPCLENGKTGFVNYLPDGETGFGSTEFIVFRGTMVSPEFVYCFARSTQLREKAIKSMIGASGRQRVQRSCFDDVLVPLPPEGLMEQFNNIAGSSFAQIKVLSNQVTKLKQARDLLLPKLMSGEVTV